MAAGSEPVQTGRAYLDDGRLGESLGALRAEVGRCLMHFVQAGAEQVEPAALLPADILIDLYGEDLRARAYTTQDPVLGEFMLRPDFTVPVVQLHTELGMEPARYAYAGSVWRRRQPGTSSPTEYLQAGFELFDGSDPAAADAEVFATIAGALGDLPVQPVTGDMGLVRAAIDALDTSERRKKALRRHLWRPERFRRLIERFSRPGGAAADHGALLDDAAKRGAAAVIADAGAGIGLRTAEDIAARLDALAEDRATPPLAAADLDLIGAVLDLRGSMADAVRGMAAIAAERSALQPAADMLAARAEALAAQKLDPAALAFEAGFGRTTLEYYDGFVFGFSAPDAPDLPQIAQGGRYDALTRVLGQGAGIPAVGGIIRPEALLALQRRLG
ncbi:ATP phosphoribosyltransferase regulatory subunit [Oceanomicrobium pacificus]|uniref:ATP phosphoribosyltransferase regulatory subunit n=1 Tax=Oceanomicrobium pacificus TaxID=2692916 RepID=A0A6B0TVN9_9RHOB|nr:ATP phosphoribosyltransferase regulatory subunit [Oceanomicrobium pacificus]MXU65292.1 ATP phosphoribosyltransferase regulatory subunit [Oceanomicrobium pacificus]